MKNRVGITLAVIGLIFFFYAPGWGAEWLLIGVTKVGIYSYDVTRITHPSKGIVQVWEKIIWTDEGRKVLVEKDVQKLKILNHTKVLYEFDCRDQKYHILSSIDYSKNDDVLNVRKIERDPWMSIFPDSILEDFYKAVCTEQEEP